MIAIVFCGLIFFCGLCLKKHAFFNEKYKKHVIALKVCKVNLGMAYGRKEDLLRSLSRKNTAIYDNSLLELYDAQINELIEERKFEEAMTNYYGNARKFPWIY